MHNSTTLASQIWITFHKVHPCVRTVKLLRLHCRREGECACVVDAWALGFVEHEQKCLEGTGIPSQSIVDAWALGFVEHEQKCLEGTGIPSQSIAAPAVVVALMSVG